MSSLPMTSRRPLSLSPLSLAVSSATAASHRALWALVTLAEALGTPATASGTPAEVLGTLAEAKEALGEAEEALAALDEAQAVTLAAVAGTVTPGSDAEGRYRKLGAAADAKAAELEQKLGPILRRCRVLKAVRNVAMVLMALCASLLSLDAVREWLRMTQECHLVPCLATIALLCQVALRDTVTSKRHLADAAGHQRHQAARYRHLAEDAAAVTDVTSRATEVTMAAQDAWKGLEEVTRHLGTFLEAVTQDVEVARGFPASARALGDIAVALGTTRGDTEETRRLRRALEALLGDE